MIISVEKKLIVGLEIGTSKVSALIGEVLSDGMVNIVGVGSVLSRGMDSDGINDLESVIKCVQYVVGKAELMANCQVSSVYLAVSGKHISCQNEIGMVPLLEEEVTVNDIDNVVHTARSVKIHDEHRILHVIPQEYTIDSQQRIKNPLGLSGVRMQAKVHLITCHNDMAKNIIKSVERSTLKVDQLIFSGLASSYSVLTHDDRELGVCLVDIGGGTMDIVIYVSGSLQYVKVIPYAGNVVTNDIAYAFGISSSDAEDIKIHYGCALESLVGKDESVELKSINNRPSRILQRQTLATIIEPRYFELLNLVNNEIIKIQHRLRREGSKYDLSAGVVLTGGAAKMNGLVNCAEKVFNSHIRIGIPKNISGLVECVQNPDYSTITGLLQYGKKLYLKDTIDFEKSNLISIWLKKINIWLKKYFNMLMILCAEWLLMFY